MTGEERVIAFVDGELSPAEKARFEAEMAADPMLAARVARHRALAEQVSAVYAPVLDEPVPPQLLTTASAANDAGRRDVRRLPTWGALAASLIVGVVAGRMAWPSTAPLAEEGGRLTARGQLAGALSRDLAAQPGVVKVGLTFRTADGRYCRTFESAPDRLAGLACRDDGRWTARTITAWTPPAPARGYRQAGSEIPPEVLASVDALMAGQPLDARAERAARDRGWK